MPNPMKTLLPLAAGLALGTWFAKRPVPPQARTLCPPAGQAGIRRQMEQLKREYEKQDRMRRDFTANVSHELKTPLTSISGYAEIIREGMVKSEDVGRFAGKIYEEAQRLITLVEDILNLSHLDEGAPGQGFFQLLFIFFKVVAVRVVLFYAVHQPVVVIFEKHERVFF